MRRVLVVVTALLVVVLAVGYVVADVRDRVPGILTRAEPIPAGLLPAPVAQIPTTLPSAPAPDPATLAATLQPLASDPALGSQTAVVVRDANAAQVLWSVGADRPRVLASLQKLISLPALVRDLPLDATMATSVVPGSTSGEVVLRAGGDTLLATGAGDPSAVAGRAGLADLAAQVARSAPAGPLALRLDTTYAVGPRAVGSWRAADVSGGYTRGVAQIGLADLRPVDGRVPRVESDDDTLEALAAALRAAGREVATPARGESLAPSGPPVVNPEVLGVVRSASYLEVLSLALATSDNALIENLVRQGMFLNGVPIPADGQTGAYILQALTQFKYAVDGVVLTDACGLSPGQVAPLSLVDAVLAKAADTQDPALRRVIAALPIAGVSGTLKGRFSEPDTALVAGVPRAKTGTLTGVSALAGTTVDADGRLLTFAIVSDQVAPTTAGTTAARAALDRFTAALTACACR